VPGLRSTSAQPAFVPRARGTQPDFSARKNHRSPRLAPQPGASPSAQAGPMREDTSNTSHFPSQCSSPREVWFGTSSAATAWS
jgi:hypothetical protein